MALFDASLSLPDNYDNVLVLNTCQCFPSTQGGIVMRAMLCPFTLQQKWERGGVASAISEIHLSVCAQALARSFYGRVRDTVKA